MSAIQQMLFANGGGSASDPNFASVVALLHFDGTNGSTTFTDQKGHGFSQQSSSAISTVQSMFGGASLLLNGTSQGVTSPTSTDWEFGSGDFTIECWIRPAATITTRQEIIGRWNTFGWGMQVMDTPTGCLRAYITNTTSGTVLVGPGATVVTSGAWHHVAHVRSGTTQMLFLDGVSQGSSTITGTIDAVTEPLNVGFDRSLSRYFNGNIDDLRITKGVARYTSNFTPPAAAFPNF